MNECACSSKKRNSWKCFRNMLYAATRGCILLFVFGPGLSFFSFVSWINYGEFLWSNVVFHAFRSCQIAQKFTLKILVKQCYHDFSIHWNSFQVKGQSLSSSPSFTPIVSATCRAGMMTVKVETQDNFLGVVQSRDYRKPECSGYGENTRITYLRINMLAQTEEKEYCGVFISQVCNSLFLTLILRNQ